ncbi:hypothetical protein [Haliangium sp. UPWRP_2]|uniref:hypothetical protein n=1 Tax=Haliangium sp. UPWRP_2 TaxID=1931276 RepID=UPI0011B1CA47|nr:hypothetical protein [Haliangium sp. UPWRP_2]
MKLCSQLVATGMGGKGRVALAVSEGTLRAPSDCCLIDSLSAGGGTGSRWCGCVAGAGLIRRASVFHRR